VERLSSGQGKPLDTDAAALRGPPGQNPVEGDRNRRRDARKYRACRRAEDGTVRGRIHRAMVLTIAAAAWRQARIAGAKQGRTDGLRLKQNGDDDCDGPHHSAFSIRDARSGKLQAVMIY